MFNRAPKRIPIKGAETKQFILICVGLVFGAATVASFNNASFSGVLICGGLCALCWFSASKVKTHYEAKDQVTRYR